MKKISFRKLLIIMLLLTFSSILSERVAFSIDIEYYSPFNPFNSFNSTQIRNISDQFIPPDCPSVTPDSTQIMPLGDSITLGMGSTDGTGYRGPLSGYLESYDVTFVGSYLNSSRYNGKHEGHPGKKIAYIKDNVYKFLMRNHADIVLLHIGTNDITNAPTDYYSTTDLPKLVSPIAEGVMGILDEIQKYELYCKRNVTVALAQIANREYDYTPSSFKKILATMYYNDALAGKALQREDKDDIVIVDIHWGAWLQYFKGWGSDFYDDSHGVHFNDEGYRKIAYKWYQDILALVH